MIGDYPTQLDEIDQWLHDNFGILPGACSSTENLRHSVARRVAEALWPKTQSLPSNVDEAAEEYQEQVKAHFLRTLDHPSAKDAFKAGAEWQKAKMPMPEDTVIFKKGIEEGKRLMLEDAVEGYVNYYEDGGGKLMAEAQVGCPYHIGDKVKIVIVKED